MKNLIPKLERIMDYYHDREGSTDEFKDVQEVHRFVMANQWQTPQEEHPPVDGSTFLIQHKEFDDATACRWNGIYFETMQYDAFDNYMLHAREIIKWRKFPTT